MTATPYTRSLHTTHRVQGLKHLHQVSFERFRCCSGLGFEVVRPQRHGRVSERTDRHGNEIIKHLIKQHFTGHRLCEQHICKFNRCVSRRKW